MNIKKPSYKAIEFIELLEKYKPLTKEEKESIIMCEELEVNKHIFIENIMNDQYNINNEIFLESYKSIVATGLKKLGLAMKSSSKAGLKSGFFVARLGAGSVIFGSAIALIPILFGLGFFGVFKAFFKALEGLSIAYKNLSTTIKLKAKKVVLSMGDRQELFEYSNSIITEYLNSGFSKYYKEIGKIEKSFDKSLEKIYKTARKKEGNKLTLAALENAKRKMVMYVRDNVLGKMMDTAKIGVIEKDFKRIQSLLPTIYKDPNNKDAINQMKDVIKNIEANISSLDDSKKLLSRYEHDMYKDLEQFDAKLRESILKSSRIESSDARHLVEKGINEMHKHVKKFPKFISKYQSTFKMISNKVLLRLRNALNLLVKKGQTTEEEKEEKGEE